VLQKSADYPGAWPANSIIDNRSSFRRFELRPVGTTNHLVPKGIYHHISHFQFLPLLIIFTINVTG